MNDFAAGITAVRSALDALDAELQASVAPAAILQASIADMGAQLGAKIDAIKPSIDPSLLQSLTDQLTALQNSETADTAAVSALAQTIADLKAQLAVQPSPATGGGMQTPPPVATNLPLLQMSDDTDPGDPIVLSAGDPALRPDLIELYVANPPSFTNSEQFEVLVNDVPITAALTTTSHGGVNLGNAQYVSIRTALPPAPWKISVAPDGPGGYTSFWVDGCRVNGAVYYFTGDPDGHGAVVEQNGCFLTGSRVGNFYAKGMYPNAAGGSTAPGALLPGQTLTPVYDKAEDTIAVTFNHSDGTSETKTDKLSVLLNNVQRDGDVIDCTQLRGKIRGTGILKNGATIQGPGRDANGKMLLQFSCDGIQPTAKKAVLLAPATTTASPTIRGLGVCDSFIGTPDGENAAGVRATACNPILHDVEISNCQDGLLGRAPIIRGQVDVHDNGHYIDPAQQSQKHGFYNNVPGDTFTVEAGAMLNMWNNGGGHNLKTRCAENNILGPLNITCGPIDDCVDIPYGGNFNLAAGGKWTRNGVVTKDIGYGNEVKKTVDAATGAVTYAQNNPGRAVNLAGLELMVGGGSINIGANATDVVFSIDASCVAHGSAPAFKPAVTVKGGFTVTP